MKTTRITTLEEHRNLLKTVFKTAKSRVLVVSPFIAESAIRHDRVPELVSEAVHRGVAVDVFTDDKLNRQSDGSWKPAASAGMASLVRSGAKVCIVNGIHNKTLARDQDLIAEGSFNWLSAVRVEGADMQRHERTMVYEGGEEVGEMVKKEIEMLGKTTEGTVYAKQEEVAPLRLTRKVFWFVFLGNIATVAATLHLEYTLGEILASLAILNPFCLVLWAILSGAKTKRSRSEDFDIISADNASSSLFREEIGVFDPLDPTSGGSMFEPWGVGSAFKGK